MLLLSALRHAMRWRVMSGLRPVLLDGSRAVRIGAAGSGHGRAQRSRVLHYAADLLPAECVLQVVAHSHS